MERPRTRYAKSGDVNVAYQMWGDGPIDVVLIPPFASLNGGNAGRSDGRCPRRDGCRRHPSGCPCGDLRGWRHVRLVRSHLPRAGSSLVLWAPAGGNPDVPAEEKDLATDWVEEHWGSGDVLAFFVRVGSEPDKARLAQLERYSATPGMAASLEAGRRATGPMCSRVLG